MPSQIHSPLPLLISLSAWILIVMSAGSVPAQKSEYEPDEVRRKVSYRMIDSGPGFSEFELELGDIRPRLMPTRYRHPFWLAAPPGSRVKVSHVESEWSKIEGDKLEEPVALEDLPAGYNLSDRNLNLQSSATDQFRLVDLNKVELNMNLNIRGDGGQTDQLVAQRVRIRAEFDPRPENALPAPLDEYDPYLIEILDGVVANHEQLGQLAAAPPAMEGLEERREWNGMLQEASSRGPILFSKIPKGGLYGITPSYLRGFGVDPEKLAADRLRAFVGNREIPLYVKGADQNRLRGDSRLLFYVPPDETGKKPYRPLWLFLGAEEAEPLRADVRPFESDLASGEISGYRTVEIFEPNRFHHKLSPSAPSLRWVTADIPFGGFESYEFEAYRTDSELPVRLRLWLTSSDNRGSSEYRVFLNGEQIKGGVAQGRRPVEVEFQADSGTLRDGTNILAIESLSVEDHTGGLTFIYGEIDIPLRSTGLLPNQMLTVATEKHTSPTVSFRKQEYHSNDAMALQVSDPWSPVFHRLRIQRNTTLTDEEGNPLSSFWGRVNLPPNGDVYFAVDDLALVPSSFETVDPPRSFSAEGPVDYLMITHESLSEELGRLANYRRQGGDVEVFTVQDVYNAFSYGEQDTGAIRDAVYHVFAERAGRRLEDVLLVGEGSEFWWEYRIHNKDVSPNMLPVYGWQNPQARIRGDEGYAQILGDGALPDVEIARISVETPEELNAVIDKIVRYEGSPPPGDWRNRHIFILDDEPEFIRVAREVIDKTFEGRHYPRLFPLQSYPYENYFRGIWRKRSVVMTDHIVEGMKDGALTATYLGHGGPNLWSGERIFHLRDIDTILNEGRYPILLAGSCDTGWIDYPQDPVKTSLSEAFVKKENGGTVAAYIPVGATSSYEHNYILTGFYGGLMHRGLRDLGSLVVQSKLDYFLYRNNRMVTEQFLLMGDPALQLVEQPELETVGISPESLLTLTGGKIDYKGAVRDFQWGMGTIAVYNYEYEQEAFDRFRVRDGKFEGTLDIPHYLEEGGYKVLITAFNEHRGEQAARSFDLRAAPARVRIEWIQSDVRTEMAQAGRPVRLPLLIANDSSQPLSGARFELVDGQTGKLLGSSPLYLEAGQELRPSFPQPIPLGMQSVIARVVAGEEPEEGEDSPVVVAETNFQMPVFSELNRYISFPASAIEVRRLSSERGTQFQIPLYNLTPETLSGLRGILRLHGSGGPEMIGEHVDIDKIPSGGKQMVSFQTDRTFEEGNETFAFELFRKEDGADFPLQTEVFSLRMMGGPDLEIVEDSLILEDEYRPAGTTVFMRFDVRNNGDAPAIDVTPRLYVGEPWNDDKIAENSVPWAHRERVERLYPGERHSFRVRWDPPSNDGAAKKIYATVKAQKEKNTANNVVSTDVTFLPPPNLVLKADEIKKDREFVQPYTEVSFTVPIANNSEEDFLREFRLTAYSRDIRGNRTRRLNERMEGLRAGESMQVQFDWMVEPGEYAIEIHLNEDREFIEETHGDNVAHFTFPYVISDHFFDRPREVWDFSEFPDYGSYSGVRLTATRELALTRRPLAEETHFQFEPQYLVEGRLGEKTNIDNLWGVRDGTLIQEMQETPEPVAFRIPMPLDDRTTVYEVYIQHTGTYLPELNSGRFGYRFEGAADWQEETRNQRGRVYMGRIETRDDMLDLELRGARSPSFDHLFRVIVAPYLGRYESPIVRFEQQPSGRLVARQETPGRSRVVYEVRHGHRTGGSERGNMNWGAWIETAPGEAIPPGPEESRFFQWRATLIGSLEETPRVRAVAIEAAPGALDGAAEEKLAGIAAR